MYISYKYVYFYHISIYLLHKNVTNLEFIGNHFPNRALNISYYLAIIN